MIIKKIYIKEFGGLRDFAADLSEGLNVFEGSNESGKSTVMAFIKFVFYGMPPKRGDSAVAARARALSWDNGVADGYAEISTDDGEYRIQRRGKADEHDDYHERCTVTDLATGAEVFRGEKPWERFIGAPENVFESTCFIKQTQLSALNEDGVGGAINDLSSSASVSANAATTLKKLNSAIKELKLRKGSGGKIPELEAERDNLNARLEKAEANSEERIRLEATVKKYADVTANLRKELNRANDRCRDYETIKKLRNFKILHDCETRISKLQEEKAALIAEYDRGGAEPTRDCVVRLNTLCRRLVEAEKRTSEKRAEYNEIRAKNSGDVELAAYAERIESLGGAQAVCDEYSRKRSRSARLRAAGLSLLLVGAAAALASLFAFFTKILPQADFKALSAMTVCGFIAVIVGIVLLPAARRASEDAQSYISSVGFSLSRGTSRKDVRARFIDFAAKCDAERRLQSSQNACIGECESSLAALRAEAASVRTEAQYYLATFGIRCKADEIADTLASEADRSEGFVDRYEELLRDIDRYSQRLDEKKDELKDDDEASLRAHLTPGAEETFENVLPAKLTYERDGLKVQLDAATQKYNDADKRLAAIEANSENPARLASELETVLDELKNANEKLEAFTMAYNAVEQARESLCRSVTPRLRSRAGQLLAALTRGTYSDLGLGEKLALSLPTPSGTHGVGVMSGGTRDAAYLALRLALTETLLPCAPVFADEILAQFDEKRAAATLVALSTLDAPNSAAKKQILLFTCHTREARLLAAEGQPFNLIRMR